MGKRVFLTALSICLLFLLTACKGQNSLPNESRPLKENIALTVWGAEEDEALLEQIFALFQTHYAGQADFQIIYQPQSESNCKDALLGDLEGGADVFAFTDDQVAALAAAGGLDPIPDGAAIQGAALLAAVEAACVGILYTSILWRRITVISYIITRPILPTSTCKAWIGC